MRYADAEHELAEAIDDLYERNNTETLLGYLSAQTDPAMVAAIATQFGHTTEIGRAWRDSLS